MGKLNSVTIDSANAEAQAKFWAQALDGYEVDSEWPMVLKSADGPTIFFQQVPERKSVKNRVHLDMAVPDRAAEITLLTALGATVHSEMDEGGYRWTVMQDPEGNEFCVTQAAG